MAKCALSDFTIQFLPFNIFLCIWDFQDSEIPDIDFVSIPKSRVFICSITKFRGLQNDVGIGLPNIWLVTVTSFITHFPHIVTTSFLVTIIINSQNIKIHNQIIPQ